MNCNLVVTLVLACAALLCGAQELTPVMPPRDTTAVITTTPVDVTPASNIRPTTVDQRPAATTDVNPGNRLTLSADQLRAYNQDIPTTAASAMPRMTFDVNPYSRAWHSSGVITRVGSGYLMGAGGYNVYPGMGNMATGSVSLLLPMGDRMTMTAGLTGNKYHLDRDAWNSFGVFGNVSYRLTDRLSLNAFGQYYGNQQFHSMASMALMAGTSYGGTLGVRVSDDFSLNVGARRLYDPYTGRWQTLPVVQPTFNLFGNPISFDAGPLLLQALNALFDIGSGYSDSYYDAREVRVSPGAVMDAGYNPNSPVRIPDALRK